jgi:hypothetical protein
MDDVVVVETADAIPGCAQGPRAAVKKVAEQLAAAGRRERSSIEWATGREGPCDSVAQAGAIRVKPESPSSRHRLSVQMHHHRAEHWVVVTGTAKGEMARAGDAAHGKPIAYIRSALSILWKIRESAAR